MTRLLGMVLAAAMAAVLAPQGSAPAEGAQKCREVFCTTKLVDVLVTGNRMKKGLKASESGAAKSTGKKRAK